MRVLTVDDSRTILAMLHHTLKDAGFEVLQASNATEAIAALEDRLDVRVVFTDVDMPGGVSGIQLAAYIRSRWPPIQIIVTSGRPWPADDPVPANVAFFPKPYRQEQVLDTVRRMAA